MTVDPIFRPPSEANSLILRVSRGCSHNRCTFCAMYKGVPFQLFPMDLIMKEIHRLRQRHRHVRRIFLSDGDALILPTPSLVKILTELKAAFPRLTRVSAYATPKALLKKSVEELSLLRAHGLSLVYVGIESGDDEVLKTIQKGATAVQIRQGCSRVLAANMKLSVTVILGLGGKERTLMHSLHTAQLISSISPTYFNALTLMLFASTPLYAAYQEGRFTPLTEYEVFQEAIHLLSHIKSNRPMIFRANHPSNHLPLQGVLPKDTPFLLQLLNKQLSQADNIHPLAEHHDPY